MHVVATNICVWIRTLVLESLKEITDYHVKNPQGIPGEGILGSKEIFHLNFFSNYKVCVFLIIILFFLIRSHPETYLETFW